jgi:hypothetical protein
MLITGRKGHIKKYIILMDDGNDGSRCNSHVKEATINKLNAQREFCL